MILGLALVLYDQPKIDAMEAMVGGFAAVTPQYQAIVREIFIGQMLIVIGIVIMIPRLILKKKEKDSDNDDELRKKGDSNQD